MQPAELTAFVDRALEALPAPRAPRTLLPRVLAAVQRWTERPWYQRSWLTWPLAWQTASLAAVACLVLAAALVAPLVREALRDASASVAMTRLGQAVGVVDEIERGARGVEATTTAVWTIWRVVLLPFVAYACGVLALMGAACAASIVTIKTFAFGKAISR